MFRGALAARRLPPLRGARAAGLQGAASRV